MNSSVSLFTFNGIIYLNFGLNCSIAYFDEIKPVFENLNELKVKKTYWRDIQNKSENVYKPILMAFMREIKRQFEVNGSIVPSKMTQYLIGTHDYYKLISNPKKQQTRLMVFNLYGSLNQTLATETLNSKIKLPTRIISLEMKPAISFRIHSAESLVVPSLKFDVQLMGVPAGIYTFDIPWLDEKLEIIAE